MSQHLKPIILFLLFVMAGWLAVSGNSPGSRGVCDPSNGILVLPTRPLLDDPDLAVSRAISPETAVQDTCGIPQSPAPTPAAHTFQAAGIRNLTTDIHDATLASAAMGDDILGVAWISHNLLYVGITRGGNSLQIQVVDTAVSADLTFSPVNRLHLVYEKEGSLYYLTADEGLHPATAEASYVANGTNPQIALDSGGWAHLFFQNSIQLRQAIYVNDTEWQIQDVLQFGAVGLNQTAVSYPDDPTTSWNDYGFLVGYIWSMLTREVRIAQYSSNDGFNWNWQNVAAFLVPEGEFLHCNVQLGYASDKTPEAGGQSWVYAAWITHQFATASQPNFTLPTYFNVNPLAPTQLANPDQIYAGFNAAKWGTAESPHAAGLWQPIPILDPSSNLTVHTQVKAYQATGQVQMQVGLDLTGGTDPEAESVIWSDTAVTPATFTELSLTVPANGATTATLFLRSIQEAEGASGYSVWDGVTVTNGLVTNGGFEDGFTSDIAGEIPNGWHKFYTDFFQEGPDSSYNRDEYTLYAAWSNDGGQSWTGPQGITTNSTASAGTTGALGACVYPLILLANEPPSVVFVYSYESGDPPPGTTFLRYGRPTLTQCDLMTDNCTDEPGDPLFSRHLVRPTLDVFLAPDPFNTRKALLVWESLQADYESKDLYTTYLMAQGE